MAYTLTLQRIEPLTHDTYSLTFDRPEGLSLDAGDAVQLALDEDGWRGETRPFTVVTDGDAEVIGFVIKSYPERDGVTDKIADMKPGDTMRLEDAYRVYRDHGPGTFIVGGSGITPFITILRDHKDQGVIEDDHLIYANETPADIILHPLWDQLGLKQDHVIEEGGPTHEARKLSPELLDALVGNYDRQFYVCGPEGLVDMVIDHLKTRGVPEGHIHDGG
ncbi:MAG: FAD-binding oxidoreductase [Shimia sp.]